MDESLFLDIARLDFAFWMERVFGLKPYWYQAEWMYLVDNNRYTGIKAYRGSGKSKVLGTIYTFHKCYFNPGFRVLLTASEYKQATKILYDIKEEVENSEFLKVLIPVGQNTKWCEDEVMFSNGSHIVVKAFTKAIKGVHVNYVFNDEIQDITDRRIFSISLAPTVNKYKGHLVASGTTDHLGDMLDEIFAKPEYVCKSYPILIEGVSICPEDFPLDVIEELRKRDGEESFQTQYMLNPKADKEGSMFPQKWIANCFSTSEKFGPRMHESSMIIMGCDFAMSSSERADFDCYVIVEKIAGKTTIRHGERHKGFPKDAKLQRIRELFTMYNPAMIILDPSSIGTAILQDLRNEGYPVQEGAFYSKERQGMLVNLQTLMQPDRNGISAFVIPRHPEDDAGLTFTNKLVEELIGFYEERSETTMMKRIVSRASHDDTVASLALACKGASEQQEYLDYVAV